MIYTNVEKVNDKRLMEGVCFFASIADDEKETIKTHVFFTPEEVQSWFKENVEQHVNCDVCQDTGEIECMETVYAGEPHQAMVGTRKCLCQIDDSGE